MSSSRSPRWILLQWKSPFQIDDVALVFKHPITEGDLKDGIQQKHEQYREKKHSHTRGFRIILYSNGRRVSHLFVDLRSWHLLQVLQVGVKQVAAGQRNPQNRLNDVADGAVVGQADLLRRVHEVTATGRSTDSLTLDTEDF